MKQKTDWKIVKIPDVLYFQEGPGVRKFQFTTNGVKLLNVGNINKGKINLDTTKIYISEKEAYGKYKHFLVDEGDLVIASSGIAVDNFYNKIAFISKENLPLCMNTSTVRFKVIDDTIIDIHYFYYFLQTNYFSNQLRRLITGSAQLNFGPSHLKIINLLLPPLEEQKEIVKYLDQANSLRQKRKRAIDLLDEYLKSVFEELFAEHITDDSEKSIELRGFINVVGGYAFKSTDFVKSGIPVIKIGTVNKGYFDLSACSFISNVILSNHKIERFRIYPGDLLMSLTGTVGKEDYGNICEVTSHYPEYLLNQRVAKIEYDNNSFTKEFLFYFFKHHKIKSQLTSISRGVRQANISNEDILRIKLVIPEKNKQEKFSNVVQNTMLLKQKMLEQSIELNNQFNALMQKHFNSN